MRKPCLIVLLFAFVSLCATAQPVISVRYRATNNGLAEYFAKIKSFPQHANSDLFSEDKEQKWRDMELLTDGKVSFFSEKEDEPVSDDEGPEIVYVSEDYWGEDCYVYKDVEAGKILMEQYYMGRPFLISDSAFHQDWVVTRERQEIMGIDCQKAVCGDTATAWFTVDIPISDGPSIACGLPGLILRLDDGHEQYECIGIEKSDEDIPRMPRSGKVVNMADFRAHVLKDLDEMVLRQKREAGIL